MASNELPIALLLLLGVGCGPAVRGEVDGRDVALTHAVIVPEPATGIRHIVLTDDPLCPDGGGFWGDDRTVLYFPFSEKGKLRVEAAERELESIFVGECELRATSVRTRLRIERDEGDVLVSEIDVEFEDGALSGSFVAEDCLAKHLALYAVCHLRAEWLIDGPDGTLDDVQRSDQ